jgi:DNA-binding transcriptional regulator LsrR (DeoR family)
MEGQQDRRSDGRVKIANVMERSAYCQYEWTTHQLAERCGIHIDSVRREVRRLGSEGCVENVADGHEESYVWRGKR